MALPPGRSVGSGLLGAPMPLKRLGLSSSYAPGAGQLGLCRGRTATTLKPPKSCRMVRRSSEYLCHTTLLKDLSHHSPERSMPALPSPRSCLGPARLCGIKSTTLSPLLTGFDWTTLARERHIRLRNTVLLKLSKSLRPCFQQERQRGHCEAFGFRAYRV